MCISQSSAEKQNQQDGWMGGWLDGWIGRQIDRCFLIGSIVETGKQVYLASKKEELMLQS